MVIAGNSVTARQHLPVREGGKSNCRESALALARAQAARQSVKGRRPLEKLEALHQTWTEEIIRLI